MDEHTRTQQKPGRTRWMMMTKEECASCGRPQKGDKRGETTLGSTQKKTDGGDTGRSQARDSTKPCPRGAQHHPRGSAYPEVDFRNDPHNSATISTTRALVRGC